MIESGRFPLAEGVSLMNRNTLLFGALVAAGLVLALVFFWPFGNDAQTLRFPGTVEIQEVRLGSKVGGRVKNVEVREGDQIEPGKVLVVFDVPELEAQREQQEARVRAAKAELDRAVYGWPEEKRGTLAAMKAAEARRDRIHKGWRKEEIKQAESELVSAEADWKKAEDKLARTLALFQQRSASKEDYDEAKGTRDAVFGRYHAAKARHDMLHKGSREEDKREAEAEFDRAVAKVAELDRTRPEEIALAHARYQEALAKLKEMDVNLKEREVIVPPELGKAAVQVVAVRPGDLVAPGQPVVRVLRIEDLYIRIYVPETQIGKVEVGTTAEITIDSHSRTFTGRVIERNPVSEFLPRNVQSKDERRHQMFGVKVAIDKDHGIFNAGMAAEVVVRVGK